MQHTFEVIFGLAFPLASIIAIILAATLRSFPGKPWLIAHLVIGLVVMIPWRILPLLARYDALHIDMLHYYSTYAIPLNIIGLVGFCLLIPFLLAVASPSHNG